MAKLKLNAIDDDKPVKVTHELPASVHRDLVAYARNSGTPKWTIHQRSEQADRADARKVHGNRSCVYEITKTSSGE
jgi:hypothetical protein